MEFENGHAIAGMLVGDRCMRNRRVFRIGNALLQQTAFGCVPLQDRGGGQYLECATERKSFIWTIADLRSFVRFWRGAAKGSSEHIETHLAQ